MAWQTKRRFTKRPARWSNPRRVTAGAVQRKLDRKLSKRYQWVPLADSLCEQLQTACKGCCQTEDGVVRGCTYDDAGVEVSSEPNPTAIVLVPPADVPAAFSDGLYEPDTLTIVRMVGKLELCPIFCNSSEAVANCLSIPDQCEVFRNFQNAGRNYSLRAALDKSKWEWDPLSQTYVVPARYPLETQEWSDAQFLRQWERSKARPPNVQDFVTMNGDAPQGCCGDVTAAGAGAPANTLSNGSGTINIPAISTDCNPCNGDPDTFRSWGAMQGWYPCFNISLNSRRRLTFKENEGLTLWFDWTSFTSHANPTDGWRPNVGFAWRMTLKALLEVA